MTDKTYSIRVFLPITFPTVSIVERFAAGPAIRKARPIAGHNLLAYEDSYEGCRACGTNIYG